MRSRRWNRLTYVACGLAALAAPTFGQRPCLGQSASNLSRLGGAAHVEQALGVTLKTGRPTVLVVTSRTSPASKQVFQAMLGLRKTQELASTVQFIELSGETSPETIRHLGVSAYPTILVYGRGAKGLELLGREDGTRDAYDAVGYLCTLNLDSSRRGTADASLVRTNHWHQDAQPSAQAAAPPMSYPAPSYQAPAAVPMMAAPAMPMVSAPAPAPIMVSAPSPSIVFQQSAPTIFVAPPQAPNIVVASAPASMPMVSVVQPTTFAAAPPQMFLSAAPAPMAAAPVAAPMMMAAAAPAMVPMVAAAAPAAAAPVAASSVAAIPAGPIGRMIGNFGEKLMKHKYPRVPGAVVTTSLAQVASVPVAGIPMAAAAPAQPMYYAPAAPASAPVAAPPPAAAASPQSGSHGHGWFFQR